MLIPIKPNSKYFSKAGQWLSSIGVFPLFFPEEEKEDRKKNGLRNDGLLLDIATYEMTGVVTSEASRFGQGAISYQFTNFTAFHFHIADGRYLKYVHDMKYKALSSIGMSTYWDDYPVPEPIEPFMPKRIYLKGKIEDHQLLANEFTEFLWTEHPHRKCDDTFQADLFLEFFNKYNKPFLRKLDKE